MSLTKTYLEQELRKLDHLMQQNEEAFRDLLSQVHPTQYCSALNLLHFLTLRSQDIHALQVSLHQQGVSTLNYSEGYIRSQLLNVLRHFNEDAVISLPICNYSKSHAHTENRVQKLFGKTDNPSIPAIMVTLKTSFASDFLMVKKLLKAGMNVARINCAHDSEKTWIEMINTVRGASEFSGIPCKIYMDLAGPKMRTIVSGKKKQIAVEEEDFVLLSHDKKADRDLPVIQCTLPGVIDQLRVGERVFFDDGIIEAVVVEKLSSAAKLEIIRVSSKKPLLKTEKGINFPDSNLSLSALTDFDRKCIPVILKHADMVGFSFVHNAPDLLELQKEVAGRLPIVVKIENAEALKNLPALLFTAMKEELYAVMIARGDLAVELGFEQIAEIQDDLFGICRAAHAPVFYATQILESMNKTGIPTRAEITDASIGILADCVMLNKGPNTTGAIKALKNILAKKSTNYSGFYPVYRKLKFSEYFLEEYTT